MNAGRDVERLIAGWLVEEAPAHAPDRILSDAGRTMDRTKQRRFTAAWREPMIISTGRLLAAAAVVVISVVGAGWIGRASAPVAGAPSSSVASPGVAPSAAASQGATLESYRAARDAICEAANPIHQPLKDGLDGMYDTGLSEATRSAKIDALDQIVIQTQVLRGQIAALEVPPQLAADQTAYLTRSEDLQSILAREVQLLRGGKLSEARELDLATDPINRRTEQFEVRYGLSACP